MNHLLTCTELFKCISTAWSSTEDIMLIANCGRGPATNIRNQIIEKIKDEGKRIPRGKKILIPTKMVVEFLELDIEYITMMAQKEQEFNINSGREE